MSAYFEIAMAREMRNQFETVPEGLRFDWRFDVSFKDAFKCSNFFWRKSYWSKHVTMRRDECFLRFNIENVLNFRWTFIIQCFYAEVHFATFLRFHSSAFDRWHCSLLKRALGTTEKLKSFKWESSKWSWKVSIAELERFEWNWKKTFNKKTKLEKSHWS